MGLDLFCAVREGFLEEVVSHWALKEESDTQGGGDYYMSRDRGPASQKEYRSLQGCRKKTRVSCQVSALQPD